jgi:hypothetical protein
MAILNVHGMFRVKDKSVLADQRRTLRPYSN